MLLPQPHGLGCAGASPGMLGRTGQHQGCLLSRSLGAGLGGDTARTADPHRPRDVPNLVTSAQQHEGKEEWGHWSLGGLALYRLKPGFLGSDWILMADGKKRINLLLSFASAHGLCFIRLPLSSPMNFLPSYLLPSPILLMRGVTERLGGHLVSTH